MIDAEFVDRIAALATQAAKTEILTHPSFPETTWLINNGTATPCDVPPPRRRHDAATVEDFAAAVSDLSDPEKTGVVWVGNCEAVAVLDDATRHDRIRLLLPDTDQFSTLREWGGEGPVALTQKELIRRLKFTFGSELPDLLMQIRKIEWSAESGSKSHLGHGGDTLGKSVDAKCSVAKDVPERIVLNVPVFQVPDLLPKKYEVPVCIEILASEERFLVGPPAGAVEAVEGKALADVATMIEANTPDHVRVYLGAV